MTQLSQDERRQLNVIFSEANLKFRSGVTLSENSFDWRNFTAETAVEVVDINFRNQKEKEQLIINNRADDKIKKIEAAHRIRVAKINQDAHRRGLASSSIVMTQFEKAASERDREVDEVDRDREYRLRVTETDFILRTETARKRAVSAVEKHKREIARLKLKAVRLMSEGASKSLRNLLDMHNQNLIDVEEMINQSVFGSYLLFFAGYNQHDALHVLTHEPLFQHNLSPGFYDKLVARISGLHHTLPRRRTAYQRFGLGRSGEARVDLRTGEFEYEHLTIRNTANDGSSVAISHIYSNQRARTAPNALWYGRGSNLLIDGIPAESFRNTDNVTVVRNAPNGFVTSVMVGGQSISFHYTNARLTHIVDIHGRRTNFTYTDNLLSTITYPEGGNALTRISYSGSQLTRIVSSANVGYDFSYTSSRVTEVTNFSELRLISGTTVQAGPQINMKSIDISYRPAATVGSVTEVTDSSTNERTSYLFATNLLGTNDCSITQVHSIGNSVRNISIGVVSQNSVHNIEQTTFPANFVAPELSHTVIQNLARGYLRDNTANWIRHDFDNDDRISREEGSVVFSNHGGTQTRKSYDRRYTYNQGSQSVDPSVTETTTVRRQRGNSSPTQQTFQKTFTYRDNRLNTIEDDETRTSFTYDTNGNVSRTSALWLGTGPQRMIVSDMELSHGGQLRAMLDQTGVHRTTFAYSNGNISQITDPLGNRASFGFDVNTDDLTRVEFSDSAGSATTENRFTSTRNLLTGAVSADTNIEHTYREFGRDDSTRVDGRTATTNTYTDGQNEDTLVTNHFNGRDAVGESYRSVFDKRGKLLRYVDARTNAELVRVDYTNHRPATIHDRIANEVTQIEYNADGSIRTQSSGDVSVEYRYMDGLVQNENQSISGRAHNYTYRYNNQDEIESITLPTNRSESYTREAFNRLSTFTSPVATTNFTYRHTMMGSARRETSLIETQRHAASNGDVHELRYTWTPTGNIQEIRNAANQVVIRNTYDAFERITREDNSILNRTTSYEYNSNGNLTFKNISPFNNPSVVNQRIDCLGGSGTNLDNLIGNPSMHRNRALRWSRLRSLESIGVTTFQYNANGLRISKTHAGAETRYSWLDDRLIAERRANNIELNYLYGMSGVCGFILRRANGVTEQYYFLKNIQGDVTHVYRDNGQLVAQYAYEAWGEIRVITNVNGMAEINPIRYRSYYFDQETGLYYLNARYYDPEVGRYLNSDLPRTAIAQSHMPNGLNLTAYCSNNPVMNIDRNILSTVLEPNVRTHIASSRGSSWHPGVTDPEPPRNNIVWELEHSLPLTFNNLWLNVSYTVSVSNQDPALFYSFTSTGINGITSGVGFNICGWFGTQVYSTTNGSIGFQNQFTPWFHYGARVGWGGLGVNFGLTLHGQTHDISVEIGWGIMAGAFVLAKSGGWALAAVTANYATAKVAIGQALAWWKTLAKGSLMTKLAPLGIMAFVIWGVWSIWRD